MKLPTWFKVIWWIFITGLAAWLFWGRIPAISKGSSAPVDVFLFLVLVALLLAPIFQEVSFFGLKFKQAVDDLKNHLSTQLSVFKADLQTTIVSSNNITVTMPAPPSDEQLPDIGEQIRSVVSDMLRDQGITPAATPLRGRLDVDEQTLLLFKVRHTIESKLRRIASAYAEMPERRPLNILSLSRVLVQNELLQPRFAHAIREIYSVCSPAIHGEPVTDAQISFVQDVAKEVIDALSEIESRTTEFTRRG